MTRKIDLRETEGRGGPRLRPTIDPTAQTVATPTMESTRANRLRNIAETLASGSKAIQDFYAMERQHEAENRMRSKAAAMAGLGPPAGRGFLQLGSREGFREGKGHADALMARNQLTTALQEANYFVDPENPDPSTTEEKLRTFIDSHWKQVLGEDAMADPDFMAGAAETMATTVLEAHLEAQERLDVSTLAGITRHAEVTATSSYTDMREAHPEIIRSPADLRDYLGGLRKNLAEEFNLSQAASSEVILRGIQRDITRRHAEIVSNPEARPDALETVLGELLSVQQAVTARDGAGMVFGGVSKHPGTGRTVDNLSQTFEDMDALGTNVVKSIEDIRERREAMLSAELQLDLRDRLTSGEDYRSIISDYMRNPELRANPELLNTMVDDARRLGVSGEFNLEAPTIANKYRLLAQEGRLNPSDITRLADAGVIPRQFEDYVRAGVADFNTTQSIARANSNYYQSLADRSQRQQATEIQTSNERLLEAYLIDHNITNPTVVQRLRSYLVTNYKSHTPESLTTRANSLVGTFKEAEQAKEAVRLARERADEEAKVQAEALKTLVTNVSSAADAAGMSAAARRNLKQQYKDVEPDETGAIALSERHKREFRTYQEEFAKILKRDDVVGNMINGEIVDQTVLDKLVCFNPFSTQEEVDAALQRMGVWDTKNLERTKE